MVKAHNKSRPLAQRATRQRIVTRDRGEVRERAHHTAIQPSAHFDWDRALLGYARLMRSLGYTLSDTQRKRLRRNG